MKEFPLKGDHRVYLSGGRFPEIYPRGSLEENSEGYSEEKKPDHQWVDSPDFLSSRITAFLAKGREGLPAPYLHIRSR